MRWKWNPVESEDAAFQWLVLIVAVAVVVIALVLLVRALG